jgi:hypothetical protein
MSRILACFLVAGITSAVALAADLSKYRDFPLGADLPAIAKQVNSSPAQAKLVSSRPALIQELEWTPQFTGLSAAPEPVKNLAFTFYNGELSRIVVEYDRYATEGMTTKDMVEAISAAYGPPTAAISAGKASQGPYRDEEEVLAGWQDSEYRFDLFRSSYGPSFRLVGILKRLEEPARAAVAEAKRLDDKEAPQRDAARIVSEEQAAKLKLEQARTLNKPKFRM